MLNFSRSRKLTKVSKERPRSHGWNEAIKFSQLLSHSIITSMLNNTSFFPLFTAGLVGITPPIPSLVLALNYFGGTLGYIVRHSTRGNKLVRYSTDVDNHSMTLLLKDCANDFIDFQVGVNPVRGNEVGDTALIIACRLGNTQGACVLLSRGADCNVQNDKGYSALHTAVESNHIGCVYLLLSQRYIRLNLTNRIGDTALTIACKTGNTVAVELLHTLGSEPRIPNRLGNDSIQEATQRLHYDCRDLLLRPSYAPDGFSDFWRPIVNGVYDILVPRKGVRKLLKCIVSAHLKNMLHIYETFLWGHIFGHMRITYPNKFVICLISLCIVKYKYVTGDVM